MEVLSEEATAVASIEDEYMELISADEGAALVRLLGQGLSSHLTETQRRRLWKYCVEGKSVRLIAKEECAYRNAVWKSIQAAKEKCLNFLWKQGVQNPVFAAIGEGIIFLPAMNLDKHRLRRSYPAT